MSKENAERILGYLEDSNYWKQWQIEGIPTPHVAAALLPSWLSILELSRLNEETSFWAHRSSIFYTQVQWANHIVNGGWGKPARYLPWDKFLEEVGTIESEKGLLLFPGKFRTLPTTGHVDTVVSARMWNSKVWHNSTSALIFEPKKNVDMLEKNKLVFDPKIRGWAYSLLPIDIVTTYPEMQNGEISDSFYEKVNEEIQLAFSGSIGIGIGGSPYREVATRGYKKAGFEIVDTTMLTKHELSGLSLYQDTSGLDNISSQSEWIEKLILSFLKNMSQIED